MKLFSTSSFVIPKTLTTITAAADKKIVLVFFWATLLRNEVIIDFFSSLYFVFSLLKIWDKYNIPLEILSLDHFNDFPIDYCLNKYKKMNNI